MPKFHLTSKQRNNLRKGKSIQIGARQLNGGASDAIHEMDFDVEKKAMTRLKKALRNNTGVRIQPHELSLIHGGDGFWDSVESVKGFIPEELVSYGMDYGLQKAGVDKKKSKAISSGLTGATYAYDFDKKLDSKNALKAGLSGVNKGVKGYKGGNIFGDVKKTVNSVGKSAKKGTSKAIKWTKKNDVGGKVEILKSVVPESYTREGVKLALIASGMDENQASISAGTATGALYGYDFGEKPSGKNVVGALQGGAKGGIKGATTSSKTGNGMRANMSCSGKCVKGSQQAKDKMARIRAMRTRNGNGFRGSGFRDS